MNNSQDKYSDYLETLEHHQVHALHQENLRMAEGLKSYPMHFWPKALVDMVFSNLEASRCALTLAQQRTKQIIDRSFGGK